jgi:hypothetical protein
LSKDDGDAPARILCGLLAVLCWEGHAAPPVGGGGPRDGGQHRKYLRERAELFRNWGDSLLQVLDRADAGASVPGKTSGTTAGAGT